MADTFNWLKSRLAPNTPIKRAVAPGTWSPCSPMSTPLLSQIEINLNTTFGALGFPIGPRER
jgi:hypothetical protein